MRTRPERPWGGVERVSCYYAGHNPLTSGVDITGVIVLLAVTLVLTVAAMVGIERRDLRG